MTISSIATRSIEKTVSNPAHSLRMKTPRVLCILALLLALPLAAWGTAAATTTTLTTGSKTVNTHTITTLTASVTTGGVTPAAVTQGLVQFYDGKALLGTGQIVKTGTKYTHGSACLAVELGFGSHSLKAVFVGTAAYASSSSAVAPLIISGGTTSTSISSSGTAGNYTLTGTVTANGATPVTGNVNFIDQTDSAAIVGTAPLGTATVARTYAAAAPYSLFASTGNDFPQQVVVADLNGDGILDMAALDYSGIISVYLGLGNGTFQAAHSFCMDTSQTPAVPCNGGNEPTSIAFGDFNSDGIPDLVFVDGSYAYVALGNGDGTFQKPVPFATQGGNSQVVVADLNRDGTPDLIVSISDGISILLGNGNGTFQPHYEVSLNDASTYITVGDFNKDGIPDIASAGWNGEALMVLLGKGNGTFDAEKDTPIDINTAGCTVAAADFKGTGFLSDVAICGDNVVEALAGKGDGTFAPPQVLNANGSFDEYVNWVTPVDMNGDGNVDLVLAWDSSATDTGRIDVFNGTSAGTFNTTPTTISTGKQPVFVTVGDLNGNGTPDLVTVNQQDNNLSVISQGASSTATASVANVSLPGTGNQSVIADYTGNSNYAASTSSAISLTGTNGAAGAPVISSLSPASAANGSGAFNLIVNGNNFASGDVVDWNGSPRTTTYGSLTKLTAAIQATDVAAAGTDSVTVVSPTAGTSNSASFTVTQSSTGPTIAAALSPNYATINSPSTTITVTGTNFVSGTTGSVVHFGTAALTTTFVSATSLTAVIPAADLKTLGTFQVTVWNAGVSASNAMPFTVGPVTHTPLAYGFFNASGAGSATSGNITCAWSTTNLDYQCTITGESFVYNKYIINATYADINTVGIVTVSSNMGYLVVRIYKTDGTTKIQAPFYLVVFKP